MLHVFKQPDLVTTACPRWQYTSPVQSVSTQAACWSPLTWLALLSTSCPAPWLELTQCWFRDMTDLLLCVPCTLCWVPLLLLLPSGLRSRRRVVLGSPSFLSRSSSNWQSRHHPARRWQRHTSTTTPCWQSIDRSSAASCSVVASKSSGPDWRACSAVS